MTRPKGSAEELARRIEKARAEQPKLDIDEAVEMLKREAWGFKHADGYCPAEDGGCELCCSLDELSELFKPVLIKALRGKEGE